jgi:hypothetical protein
MPLRGSPIFFVRSPHDDLQRIIQQWSLQSLGLVPRRTHPHVALFIRRQDHRHGLWMDRLDDSVRRGGQEAIDEMRHGDQAKIWYPGRERLQTRP